MNIIVSIIIPFYNREKYITKCLDSVLNQSYQNIEVILINDASTDNTMQICQQYMKQDPRIKLLCNEINLGVSRSRNIGLEAANGEYIVFVDSDDFITKYYVEALLRIALEQQCEMVQCKLQWGCNLESQDVFSLKSPYFMTIHRSREKAEWALQSGSDARLGGMVCGKLYHRKLFMNVQFPEGKIHEDEGVMHRLIYETNQVACISGIMYYQVDSKSSIMRDCFSPKRYDLIEQLEDRYLFFIEKGLVDCAYVTAQRIGGTIIEFYRKTKEVLHESNEDLLKLYVRTLPRYIDSPFMTEEAKQLHLIWLNNPDIGDWYFVNNYMRKNFSTISDWEIEVNKKSDFLYKSSQSSR